MSDTISDQSADSEKAPRSMDTPLLIGAIVVISAMLAWFFLGDNTSEVADIPLLVEPLAEDVETISAVVVEQTPSDELLQRARLAAEAGMLVAPAGANALYYYVQFAEQNPDSAEAEVELQQVADQIGTLVNEAVAQNDWARAATVVGQLNNAGVQSDAAQSFETQLAQFRAGQQRAALSAAESGNENAANRAIDVVAGLPRTQPGDILALRSDVRDALVAKRLADQAAAQRAAERAAARVAAARQAAQRQAATAPTTQTAAAAPKTTAPVAVADPLQGFRTAIAGGDIAAARNAFDELPSGLEQIDEARSALIDAYENSVRDAAASGTPDVAEQRRAQLASLDSAASERLGALVNRAYIESATAETISAATLRRISAAAPNYPRNALRRNLTGRVKVEFTVGTDGATSEIEVVETTSSVFNRSAVQAIADWQYEPREVRGQLVAQRVYAYLDYTLE